MFDKYPYTNFHELNLDYFIKEFKRIFAQWDELYTTMTRWKDATDADLAAWKASTLADMTAWETALLASLDAWKAETGADISSWESGVLSDLADWKDTFTSYAASVTADAEAARDAAAGSATAAAGSATAAAGSATAAADSATDAASSAAGVAASVTQIATNTQDISDLKTQLSNVNDAFTASPNIFNKDTKEVGAINSLGLVDISYTSYYSSDYIPVTAGNVLRGQYDSSGVRYDSGAENVNFFYRAAFYNENKEFITGSWGGAYTTVTAPQNATYFRFSISKTDYDNFTDIAVIASSDSEIIPYYPYGSIGNLKTERIPSDYDLHINELIQGYDYSISPRETTFFYVSKNMINPSDCVNGEYVNQNNGNFVNNENYNRTKFITVEAETTYVLRLESGAARFRYAFYNASKQYLIGAMLDADNDMIITSPANAEYVVVSLSYTNPVNKWMLAKYVDGDKTFEAYDYAYLYKKYLPPEEKRLFLNLPAKIYASTGFELNVYFNSLTENWNDYAWKINCEKGEQWERGFVYTPIDADAGTYNFTVTILSEDMQEVVLTKTASLIVTPANAGSGQSKSIIVLGDSTTNNGTVIVKLNDNFADDQMTISTLGTRGVAPNNMEGRAGWKLKDYFTKAASGDVLNPFYNPTTHTFDADYYFTTTGIAKPNWFIVNMGINDMFDMQTDSEADMQAASCVQYINAIIDSVHDASPSTKIGVCVTIPPNNSQDAFGKAYGANRQTRDRYKRNNLILANAIINAFDGKENNGVYIIPIHTNLDTIYNMGMETIPVNSRNNTTYNSPTRNGGVHPAESGYWQIADVYTAFLKGTL